MRPQWNGAGRVRRPMACRADPHDKYIYAHRFGEVEGAWRREPLFSAAGDVTPADRERSLVMKRSQINSGFSLIEMMIVLVILLTITGAIFQVINLATARSSAEQTKVDMFQEGREFMDQMSRDMRVAGYPSPRNMDPAVLTTSPAINDLHAAA